MRFLDLDDGVSDFKEWIQEVTRDDAWVAVSIQLTVAGILSLPAVALLGFEIKMLWLWFVSEPFQVMELNISHSLGLVLLIALVRPGPSGGGLVTPTWVLIFMTRSSVLFIAGWALHFFV